MFCGLLQALALCNALAVDNPSTAPRFAQGYDPTTITVHEGHSIEDISSDGLIGRSFLSNFDADFDYPDGTIYLSPPLY